MIKTEAGEKMKEENPVDKIDTIDGQELLRQELEKQGKKFGMPETPEMNMGGLMGDGMGVIIGIEAESGNNIPAGSKPEEVADDIPAMLSEGEYVVPADVVRWHGVKTFEELRCEAKMGMGLMAHDGRIAMVDEDTKEPVDYDIEEEDKPEVEKAKVEVIHAADGVDVSAPTYYNYRYMLDPESNRYRMVPVDPDTGAIVTSETFDPARSTRYAPRDVLAREVYGRPLGEPEKDETECPEGMVYDEEIGACVPIEQVSVTAPVGDGGGDGPQVSQVSTPYGEQLSTKIAEDLGPLSAEDLSGYEGDTLAEQALARATDKRGITPLKAATAVLTGPLGMAGLAGRQLYNEVGAKRAMMTRTDELSNWGNITDRTLAGNVINTGLLGTDPVATGDLKYTGPRTYNASFNPNTASFDVTSTSRITGLQERPDGSAWATDYQHTDAEGNDIDPFDPDLDEDTWGDFLEDIDDEFDNLSEATGTESSDKDDDKDDDDGFADSVGSDPDDWSGGGEEWNKGGYVTKKNKPKVATMQYSKGSK